MAHVLVVGAGRVGRAIVHMLAAEAGTTVRVADVDPAAAARVANEVAGATAHPGNAGQPAQLDDALRGVDAVVSAAPFSANPAIAAAAQRAAVHYLDLTEDVAVTRAVRDLAQDAACAMIPQCGVAPGFVSIAATHVAGQLDEVDTLNLRVGALPRQPNNRLHYCLTWSTEGLVNEYIRPCEALRDGRLATIPPLEDREELIVDGVAYEAFTTSGGVGSLCRTHEGRIRHLDYKSIRYPGHLDRMRFLLDDLGFRSRPSELVALLERSIPTTDDDRVLVSVRALGTRDGRLAERTWWHEVRGVRIGAARFTAIETATTAGVCGVLHLLLEGALPTRGFVRMEDVPYERFLATPFGHPFRPADG